MIVFDGKDKTKVTNDEQSIKLALAGNAIAFIVDKSIKPIITVPETEYNHRNGIAKVAEVAFDGDEIKYTISLP